MRKTPSGKPWGGRVSRKTGSRLSSRNRETGPSNFKAHMRKKRQRDSPKRAIAGRRALVSTPLKVLRTVRGKAPPQFSGVANKPTRYTAGRRRSRGDKVRRLANFLFFFSPCFSPQTCAAMDASPVKTRTERILAYLGVAEMGVLDPFERLPYGQTSGTGTAM